MQTIRTSQELFTVGKQKEVSNRIKTVSSSIRIKEIYFQQSILGVPLTLYIPRKMKI